MRLLAFASVLAWVVLAVAGDVQLKEVATSRSILSLAAGSGFYAATVPVAVLTYRNAQWGWVAVVWSSAAVLASITLSVVLFHESMTWRRVASVVLCILAIGLAE